MSRPTLTVGLIGYQFMGKAHSNAYRQVGRFFDLPMDVRMKTVCGRNEAAVSKAAGQLGWEGYETDYRKVLDDPEIDVVDVSTPGDSHREIAVAAAKAGKIVFCEKPIGNTLGDAQEIYDAVVAGGRPSAVFHNYRKAPAVALAKQMIEEGKLGRLYHIRAVYLQDWIADPKFPLVWRLQKDKAGSGAHGDIASHIIDLGRHLLGEFDSVTGLLHTFIKQRPLAGEIDDRLGAAASTDTGEVTVDDASLFLAKFKSGAIGTFEATRFAVGRKNHNRFEINGEKGSIVFNLERMNELEYYNNEDPANVHGFRLIQATDGGHPYAGHYWPAGHIIGYEHTFINLVADAVTAIANGKSPSPNIEDGLRNQIVLDAVERSNASGGWITV
ncbi:MAG: Gfo/Idh/MocA family oxidoreductase [Armatimonadetes bacterium]|nr:Gfo/Idh/MocA family oxidoreductase [Armatimonadota bacterium]